VYKSCGKNGTMRWEIMADHGYGLRETETLVKMQKKRVKPERGGAAMKRHRWRSAVGRCVLIADGDGRTRWRSCRHHAKRVIRALDVGSQKIGTYHSTRLDIQEKT
jgi:hypothetical protein